MSWFLSSGKSSKRGKAKSKPKAKEPWDPQRTLMIIQVGGWCALIAAVVLGWYFGEEKLAAMVGHRRAAPPQVVMHDVPAWMSDRVVRELGLTVAGVAGTSPFDHEALQAAAARLSASPWVRRVERVARNGGGKIDVHADYREPAAIIEVLPIGGIAPQREYHMVDADSIRLPAVYRIEHLPKLGLPLIRGVHQAPPAPGLTWPGGDLRAGIELAGIVSRQPWATQVQAIDVTNYGGRRYIGEPQLKLLTRLDDDHDPRNNSGVAWGRAPGDEQFYEPPAATKLANMRQLLRRYSTIDADGKVVDLFRDVVHIHPLEDAVNYTVSQ